MTKRNLLREFLVYSFSSASRLLLKGKGRSFISDMRRFFYWRKTRLQNADTLHVQIPWMVFDAVDFLRGWLKPTMKVYEYGSGSSTLFFASMTEKIISVEHHEAWHYSVESFRRQNNIKNIEYHLFKPTVAEGALKPFTDPDAYSSCFPEYQGLSFQDYVQSIDRYPDAYFDLVVVDGRSRCSCIKHAMKKVKVNGILLVDNSDRGYYLKPFPELFDKTKWEARTFVGHVPYNPPSAIETTSLFTKKCV